MQENRLLERIRYLKEVPQERTRKDPKRVIDSVLKHLQRILNTRQGSVPIGEDYGMPDFTYFLRAYPDSIREIERSIRETIQKYEPRLKAIQVNSIPNDEDVLSLRFQIIARLATDEDKGPVLFESILGSDGKMSVRR